MKKYSEHQNQHYQSTDDLEVKDQKKAQQHAKKSKQNYLDYGFDDEDDLKEYERFLR